MPEVSNESVVSSVESLANKNLDELKKSIIKETVDEIINKDSWLFSGTKRKLLNKYISEEWNAFEMLEDYVIENLLENDISEQIKQFKEDVNKANTAEELDTIKANILNQIKTTNPTTTTDTPSVASSVAAGSAVSSSWSSRATSRRQREQSSSSTEHYSIDEFDIDVSQKYEDLYNKLKWPELPDLEPFACAMKWYDEMKETLKNPTYLTVVDFTKPNDENRFYVINMTNNTVEYATTVWHGSGSWRWKFAKSFSNTNWSYQSSLGFYRVPDNIEKKARWSGIRMTGTEWSNDNASSRGIYMHPWGHISQWCFTLPKDIAMEIMNKIKWDSLLFAYAKSKDYFAQSDYFDTNSNWDMLVA